VPLGAFYQLTILVTPFHRAGGGDVWAVNRSLRDFTDDEVELSARLQPALTVLHRASEHRPTLARSDNTDRLRMTTREVEILGLLAQGFTADQMAHITRISPRTVRKHLENIYEKMQCHDRLIAVRRAADLGLISPDASNGSQRRSPSERSTAV
jgi:DNA-binding NarL/FixJ family response regulator